MIRLMFFGVLVSSTAIVAAQAFAVESVSPIPLAGEWRFRVDPDDVGIKENWQTQTLPERTHLPGSMNENGFGDAVTADTQWTGTIVNSMWHKEERFAKYRQPGNTKIMFWLQPDKYYVGPAWYQTGIELPDNIRGKHVTLLLERCHWETRAWLDDVPLGIRNSLSVPHEYDLGDATKPGKHVLTIRVDNRVKINVGQDAHSVSDNTQTNWNGIIGSLSVVARDRVWVSEVQIFPDLQRKAAKVVVEVSNATGAPVDGTIRLEAKSWNNSSEHVVPPLAVPFHADSERAIVTADYVLGDGMQLWSEFSPALYKLSVTIESMGGGKKYSDGRTVDFGMREFKTNGTQFTMNGNKVFLRGTLECCIFPLTGYPPTDIEPWLRILRIARAHGLNHLRFHSWCPPEAAFEAADRMGFAYHIECTAWATVGDGEPVDEFVRTEGDRILKAYGNHPSFCMMAYGNEPGGKRHPEYLTELVKYWKAKDPRRLYTSAAGWPIIPENDYDSTPAPRVQAWGGGLKSRINAKPFETRTDYRDFVAKYPVPVVSHEIGQWCVYPNLEETKKYTGPLKARNFEIFRDLLEENHMLDQAHDFLIASGKLQALCYKEDIEAALRTPGFGGFQLLDLHDFPGQGTALVGVLDPFWDEKGYITADEYHHFAGPTVPLLRMDKCVWTANETFTADVEIAHFGAAPIENARPRWRINDSVGTVLLSGDLPPVTIPLGNAFKLGLISASLAKVTVPAKLTVTVEIADTPYLNTWDIWVYPAAANDSVPKDVFVVDTLSKKAVSRLKHGGKVLLLPAPGTVKGDQRGPVPAGFSPIFWNTFWTNFQPPHTLGILCDPKHPALAEFPTEFHSNWQWWDLIHGGQIMILNDLPPQFRPTVQVIDDWVTARRLGLVFEAQVESGKLLVCSSDLKTDLDVRPVARQMRRSLLDYMASERFNPSVRVDVNTIQGLFQPAEESRPAVKQ